MREWIELRKETGELFHIPESGEVWVGQQEAFLPIKSDQIMEWGTQVGGRLTVTGGVQTKPG